ncbi:uncharacterized protein [Aristolochia californica]|uniref:uncharacterized protein n=1 Tax=Aristolochia californica TaxID=171875 RepID=UPI0035D58143
MAAGETNGCWTDEKHVSFLNRLEESFVKTMLKRSDLTYSSRHAYHPPALDRDLPDCAESTLDTKCLSSLQRRQTHLNNEVAGRNIQRDARRKANGTMMLPSTDDNASEDQVVPKLARKEGDNL